MPFHIILQFGDGDQAADVYGCFGPKHLSGRQAFVEIEAEQFHVEGLFARVRLVSSSTPPEQEGFLQVPLRYVALVLEAEHGRKIGFRGPW
jgi:hypothetical protein